jgi:peptidoglycan/LPS O-acetylase OafA/YrhL
MAWWVVLSHFVQLNPLSQRLPVSLRVFVNHGNWAVQIFMIVSGFVITNLLLSRPTSFQSYLTQRFFRLYPLFCFASLLAVVVSPLELAMWAHPLLVRGYEVVSARIASEHLHPFIHFVLHATLLHGVIPDDRLAYASSAFLPPAWSLSVEWQFYIAAPVILWAATRRGIIAHGVLALGIAASAVTTFGHYGWWRYLSFLPDAMPYFFVGIATNLLVKGKASVSILMATFAGVAIAATSANTNHASGVPVVLALWAVFVVMAIGDTGDAPPWARWTRPVSRIVATNRVVLYLGQISYSTYLIHIPVLGLVVGTGTRLRGGVDPVLTLALTVAAVPLIIIVSAFTHRYIELPGIRLGQRLTSPVPAKLGYAA